MLRRLLPTLLVLVPACGSPSPSPAAGTPAPSQPSSQPSSQPPTESPTPTDAPTAAPTDGAASDVAPGEVSIEQVIGTMWRIDEATLTELALDLASGRVRGRADGSGGVVIEEIAADSVAQLLGLRQGDRLQRINGVEITGAASLRAALIDGRRTGLLAAEVRRGDQSLALHYRMRRTQPLRKGDDERDKGLALLGETLVANADGSIAIDTSALPSFGSALPNQGRNVTVLARVFGLGALHWTRVVIDGKTTELGGANTASTVSEPLLAALVAGREVTFGFAAPDGTGARDVRVTAREGLVDPAIVTAAASLLERAPTSSSLDREGEDPTAPTASTEGLAPVEGFTKISDTESTITRAVFDRLAASPADFGKTARIVPNPEGGLRLFGIRRNQSTLSFAHFGFANGDRVLAINGMPIDNLSDALEVYTKVRTLETFTVSVLRRDVEIELVIRVVP